MKNLLLILFIMVSTIAYSQSKTALLIIDIQNDYFEGGACELVNPETASQKAALILEYFRTSGQPVVHIQHVNSADAPFFKSNTVGVEIHKNVSPTKEEKIVIKNYPNSFRETDLLETLKKGEVTDLVIVGMMTHMCVDATTRAAKDYGFNCTVISDACATMNLQMNGDVVDAKDVHNAFLAALSLYYANVVDSKVFLEKVNK